MKDGRPVILANPSSEWMMEFQNVVVLDAQLTKALRFVETPIRCGSIETELIRLALQPTIYFLSLPSHRAWFWVILQGRLLFSAATRLQSIHVLSLELSRSCMRTRYEQKEQELVIHKQCLFLGQKGKISLARSYLPCNVLQCKNGEVNSRHVMARKA